MNKPGTLRSATNFPPFKAENATHPGDHAPYVPKDRRLDQWLMQKKLTPDVYLAYVSELTLGFARRQGDVTAKRKYDAMMQADVYHPPFAPIPVANLPPEVVSFSQQIGAGLDRSWALCLHGPSGTGETGLARQLAPHIYMRNTVNWDKWEFAGTLAGGDCFLEVPRGYLSSSIPFASLRTMHLAPPERLCF